MGLRTVSADGTDIVHAEARRREAGRLRSRSLLNSHVTPAQGRGDDVVAPANGAALHLDCPTMIFHRIVTPLAEWGDGRVTRPLLRLAAAVTAAMLLSSCWWVGPPLYTGDPADAGPVKPGLYKAEMIDAPDQPGGQGTTETFSLRVAWLRDGSVRWTPVGARAKDRMNFIAVRFAVPGRDLWIVQNRLDKQKQARLYGLMEMRADGLWVLPAIDCDTTADIVRAAGGTVSGGSEAASNVVDADAVAPEMAAPPEPVSSPTGKPTNQSCEFADRTSLERALRAYVATKPAFSLHILFKRIGD